MPPDHLFWRSPAVSTAEPFTATATRRASLLHLDFTAILPCECIDAVLPTPVSHHVELPCVCLLRYSSSVLCLVVGFLVIFQSINSFVFDLPRLVFRAFTQTFYVCNFGFRLATFFFSLFLISL